MEKRYAVVAGSAGGIGGECVRMLLEQGWDVFGLDMRPVEPTVFETSPAGKFIAIACDVSDEASVKQAFDAVRLHADRLHAMLCCTGILRVGPLDKMSTSDFDSAFDVNVRGSWLCGKAAVPLLEAGAGPQYPSRMIFLSSAAGFRPRLNGGAYSATKAAVNMITRAFACELAPRGILVNAVAPGPVDTPFVNQATTDGPAGTSYKPGAQSPIPRGNVASASEIAAVLRFLLSNDANNFVGAILACDGGVSAVRM